MQILTDGVRDKFVSAYPFSLISNIILYRNDRKGSDLFANEIDHLFHHKKDGKDHLVIVEVKQREIYGLSPSHPPTSKSPWKLDYCTNGFSKNIPERKSKDIRAQVQDQALALEQFCRNVSRCVPKIECWIVDLRQEEADHVIADDRDHRLKLLTFTGFERQLEKISHVIRVEHSDFLRTLRLGSIAPDLGHPEIPNAIRFISVCRKSLDDQIFRFFKPRAERYAINGCAGMGKSMLLTYSLFVFASDHEASRVNDHIELKSFSKSAKKIGIPEQPERRIYVYAVKRKQVEALRCYWHRIRKQIAKITRGGYQPALQNPVFGQWRGCIPKDCNILVIDEAHDLSYEDQALVAEWLNSGNANVKKYLLVACDRNQALKRTDSHGNIIAGISFSRHTTRLNRVYRCPFPVYAASVGLLFRWFAPRGGKVMLKSQKVREHFGFGPYSFPKVKRNGQMILTMRNDSHPGNNWQQTVNGFRSCKTITAHLSQFKFDRDEVLWARFQKTDSEFDYSDVQRKYTFIDLSGPDAIEEADSYIKGQEFPLVVVEGLPEKMNPSELAEKDEWESSPSESEYEMWRIRRCLYMICTRAWAFLYFVTSEDTSATSCQELDTLIGQLSRPVRRGCESGQTWEFEVVIPKTARVLLVFRDAENELSYWEEERAKQAEEEKKEKDPPPPLRVVMIDPDRKLDLPYLGSVLGIKRKALTGLLPENHAEKPGDKLILNLKQANTLAKQVGVLLKSA